MREGQGFVVMYSITSRASFEEAQSMINKIVYVNCKGEDPTKIPIVFVGNKSDLSIQRQVTQQQARSYAESQNLVWFETSAKDNINIEKIFVNLALQYAEKRIGGNKGDGNEKLNDFGNKSIDITLAVIGSYKTGKNSLVQAYDHKYKSYFKKGSYWKQIDTNEVKPKPLTANSGANRQKIDNSVLGYAQKINVTLNVYDYQSILRQKEIIRQSDGFIIVCDVMRKRSFEQVSSTIHSMRSVDGFNYLKPIVIAANKCDVADNEREYFEDDINRFVAELGINGFLQTSVINNINVNELFDSVIACIRAYSTNSSMEKIKNVYQHSAAAWCMSLSVDSKYLYLGSHDGTIRAWDIESGTQLAVFTGATKQIYKIQEIV